MIVERVLLIRHGETDWNVQGRWQGFEPTTLNDHGRRQARALAKYLRGRAIGAIYASDLARAWETATIVGDVVGVTPQAEERLRELHFGIFQGYTWEQMKAEFPNEIAAWHDDYYGYVIPNGESRGAMQQRVHAAWEWCTANSQCSEIALVSHGGTIKSLLLKLFETDMPEVRNVHIANTSITTLARNGAGWELIEAAATPHLSDGALDNVDGNQP